MPMLVGGRRLQYGLEENALRVAYLVLVCLWSIQWGVFAVLAP